MARRNARTFEQPVPVAVPERISKRTLALLMPIVLMALLGLGTLIALAIMPADNAPVQSEQQAEEVSAPVDNAPAHNPAQGLDNTSPVVEAGWSNLGAPPVKQHLQWLIPQENAVYAKIFGPDDHWWKLDQDTGKWSDMGQAKFDGESRFQLGDPPTLTYSYFDPYAGFLLEGSGLRDNPQFTDRLRGLLATVPKGEQQEGWGIVNLARDHNAVAIIVWHFGERLESGLPPSPTPRLYLSTDNTQSWRKIALKEAKPFDRMMPFTALGVKEGKDGAIGLYIAGESLWHATIAP